MTRPPPLLLLTAAYPFGSASETFLESELPVLARRFGRVLVVPSHREPGVRPLPEGAELVEMAWLDGYSGAARRRALLSRPALRIARTTLLGDAGDARAHLAGARSYADILARNLLKARDLRAFVEEEGLQDAIAYDYWFENSTLALALLRREGRVAVAVARAHRFDLYDEEWRHGRVPFRRAKARELDRIFPVSAYGARYLEERLPGLGHKIEVARLGVPASGEDEAPAPEEGEPPTLVTCGSLVERKRVHRVPGVLAELGRPLRWVHFGDGPDRDRVEAEARARLPDSVQWSLAGHVDNRELLRYYREHRVDAFLSLSVSEGLPVSIMEAVAAGIPVVAVGVHGIPEIVNDTTGVLLPRDAGVEEAAAGLTRVLDSPRFERERIRAFHRDHFVAETNYNRFADALLALREAQGPRR